LVVFVDDLFQIVHFFFVQLLELNYVLGDVLFILEAKKESIEANHLK
jgi:hypothetical protein